MSILKYKSFSLNVLHRSLACSLAGVCVLASGNTLAQTETSDSDIIHSDTHIVTANRMALSIDETLASVKVITRQDIERQQSNSVQDVLSKLGNLSVVNNGGAGKTTSVFMRGAESDQVLVLIDGVKVGSATLGTTAFQFLSVDQIERIEIVKGPRSSLYGSEAIGGVIQIFTRRGEQEFTPSFTVTGGSDDYVKTTGGVAGSYQLNDQQSGWYNLSASFEETSGFDSCANITSDGCFADEPDKDGFKSAAFALNVGHQFSESTEASLSFSRTDNDNEYDGSFSNESDALIQVLSLSLKTDITKQWQSDFTVGRSWDESETFLNNTDAGEINTERDSFSWVNVFQIFTDHQLTWGADYQQDEVDSDVGYAVTDRDNKATFVQLQGQWQAHSYEMALRYDDNEQFGNETTGSLAWGYDLGAGYRVHSSYGTAFKAPSFNELYYPGFGNADLSPETSSTVEVGLHADLEALSWSVTWFQTHVDDLIVYDSNIFAPNNVDSARIKGLEMSVSSEINEWDLQADLAMLSAKDRSGTFNDGNDLPRRADQSLALHADRDFARFSTGMTLRAESDRFDDAANNDRLAGYVTLDLRAVYYVTDQIQVQGKIENAMDQSYETAQYYPQNNRSYYVTLAYRP